ncbi:LysM peptidoglycan-binding domain-containing protein [Lacticaseibacillus jixianensis]|uniref:LysM peptidoglycan-binding domain-containing protein n=1 Tax=Lacticaseibacillus jixianensis TaxID=2486012 RepID=A0ABW4B5C5_9LACO|nr:LysM domain-containing protein [Lacticaseibacillus jixianensis]
MNKKTDHKKPDTTDQDQPWNKQFEDDRDDEGNLSRVATRKKSHGTKVLQYVLWVLIALFIIVPVAYNAISNNSSNNNDNKITVASSKKSSSTSSSKPKKKRASSSKSASSTTSSESSSSSAETSSSQSSSASTSSSAASSSSTSSASSSTTGTSYVVKQGDNAYRIALNHGISLTQFYQWNGRGTLTPGQSVRVK